MSQLNVEAFYHSSTSTISYLIYDKATSEAAIIDSALDYDPASGQVSTTFADQQLDYINNHQLKLKWVLETHAHADHLTAAFYLKQHPQLAEAKPETAIGKNISQVQRTFSGIFSLTETQVSGSGEEFDHLLAEGDKLNLGQLTIQVLETPGHTPDGISYLIEDNIFVGDTLFMPDAGTARCDFPGGSATTLYKSIEKIHALPEQTHIWLCHDYQPNQRSLAYQTSVGQSKKENIHVNQSIDMKKFIEMRTERDQTLAAPKLLYPSLQVNIRAGELPGPDEHNKVFFKIPVKLPGNFQPKDN